jgi:hypothetical protein
MSNSQYRLPILDECPQKHADSTGGKYQFGSARPFKRDR